MAFDAGVLIPTGSYVEWLRSPKTRGIVRDYRGKMSHDSEYKNVLLAYRAPPEDVYGVEFILNGHREVWGCWRSDLRILDPLA